MIKASSNLQDLRRRIYAKAKAETVLAFLGFGPGNVGASAGRGGVGSGSMKIWGSLRVTGFSGLCRGRKRSRPDRSHNPWREASRKAQCGKSARCV